MDQDQKKKKMLYIMSHAAEGGYDTSKFTTYLKSIYGPQFKLGESIDMWTLDEVKKIVEEYNGAEMLLSGLLVGGKIDMNILKSQLMQP